MERPLLTKDGKICELGSLIVIAYKGSMRDRMRLDGFLRRAPSIRFCRGVYAFSQWHKRFDKSQELVDAGRFWNFISEVDENAIAISRLIIDNPESIERIFSLPRLTNLLRLSRQSATHVPSSHRITALRLLYSPQSIQDCYSPHVL